MGDVWKGTDEALGRVVAIKVMPQSLMEEKGFAQRWRAGARVMATINHPGVARIYDFGGDQFPYLITEYVEGEPLSRTLNRVGRLTPARTMALIAQAAAALQAAHDKGIVHRDIKPGNLVVRPNGTVVLTDFSIAGSVTQLSTVGAVLGTASYLAPERALGHAATPLSDVYSLGVVAYQCLSGHRPFEGESPLEIAMKHVVGTPRPLPADVPKLIRDLVERAMSKEPGARFESAAAFAAAAAQAAAAFGIPTSHRAMYEFRPSAYAVPAPVPMYAKPAMPSTYQAPRRRASVVVALMLAVPMLSLCAYLVYAAGAQLPRVLTSAAIALCAAGGALLVFGSLRRISRRQREPMALRTSVSRSAGMVLTMERLTGLPLSVETSERLAMLEIEQRIRTVVSRMGMPPSPAQLELQP
jgi:serine/threonine-protein kinase